MPARASNLAMPATWQACVRWLNGLKIATSPSGRVIGFPTTSLFAVRGAARDRRSSAPFSDLKSITNFYQKPAHSGLFSALSPNPAANSNEPN
jgi:hypothetical protein